MTLLSLLGWQLKIAWAGMVRGRRARVGQRILLTTVGLFWLAMLGAVIYLALGEAIRRTPEATWLLDLTLYSAWLGALAMVIFFNLGFLLHVVFFSRDLEFLMATPVDPRVVLGSRFAVGMWSNLLLNLFLSMPAVIAVGAVSKVGPAWYALFAVAQISFLAIPVALTYLIGIPLARWVSTQRLRALFSILGFGLALFLWSLPQLAPSRIRSAAELDRLMNHGIDLLRVFQSPAALLWPSTWAAAAQVEALRGHWGAALSRLLVLAGVAALLVAVSIRLAAHSYRDGWIRLASVATSRQVRSERFTFLLNLVPRDWRPLLWKDLTIVARDFRLSFQLYSLGILMCLFPFMTLATSSSEGAVMAPLTALSCALGAAVVVGSQAGIMLIPMEGRSAWRLLAAPVSPQNLAVIKWLTATCLTLPVVVGQAVLLMLAFHRSFHEAFTGGLIALGAALLGAGFGTWTGVSFANFEWDHPRRMISPGAQIIWGLGVGLITGGMVFLSQAAVWSSSPLLTGFPSPGVALLVLLVGTGIGALGALRAGHKIARMEWEAG
ncbi:MAG: hypothetical protein SGI90_14615 [Candidatus Eisenbacteria bacterium]|nr:hypothetical protein [Candidatus Eisenbacteria bacterium]